MYLIDIHITIHWRHWDFGFEHHDGQTWIALGLFTIHIDWRSPCSDSCSDS